jgi:uncharacterized protein
MKNIFIFFLFILVGFSHAQIPERPDPPRLYNNFSREFPDFLSSAEAARLEEKLEVFSNETSNQICVVIIDDLGGYEAADFSFRLSNAWGVGKKDKDNGVVILIKPTGSAGGRDLAIAVGYGLEGAIPDLATKRIREEEMQPFLKEGQNFTALDRGTDVLMKLAKGEINVKDYTRQQQGQGHSRRSPFSLIIIIIVVIIILRSMFGGGGGGGRTFSRSGSSFLWGSILGSMLGGGRRGYGGGGFGGGGFGGGGGGGWGGFGGGGFGGGGSSGKW